MASKNISSEDQEIKHNNHIDALRTTVKEEENAIKTSERVITQELESGYNVIKKYPRTVSIFGSARFGEDNSYYKKARSLAARIVKELKYVIVTGGGPGIMEAANRGAYEAGGVSLGFSIKLPKEQKTNKYVTESVDFGDFFTRKTLLFFGAEAYVYYPGGFGTLDELFGVITSIQTKKFPKTPIMLVGKEYWAPFLALIREKLLVENNTINKEDLDICTIIDSEDEIMEIIKNASYRQE